MRSGLTNVDGNATPLIIGKNGFGWSSYAIGEIYGHTIAIYGDGVVPSNTNGRWGGFPLRCLAS